MAAPLAAPLPESPSRTPVRRRIPRRGLEVFLPRAVESVADLLDTNRDTEEVVRDVFYTHGQGGAIDPDSLAAVIKEALLSDVPEGTSVVDDLSALIDQHKKTEFAVADLNHHRQLDFEEFVIYFNRLKDLIADAIRADARKRRGEVVNPESQEEELATPAPLRPSAASDGGGGLSRRQSFGDSSMAPMVPKSDEVSAMLVTSMQAHFLFRELDQTQLSAIAAAMFERRVAAGETIMREGEAADNWYIVGEGEVEAHVKAVGMVGSFGPGQIFGELAMMYDCERQATVVASQASQLWALDRRTHAQITAAVAAEGDPASYVEMLQRVPLLQGLSHELLEQTAHAMRRASFAEGEYIVRQGETSPIFCLVQEGTVSVLKQAEGEQEVEVDQLEAGQFFGEAALRGGGQRSASCKAFGGPVKLLTITRQKMEDLLGELVELLSAEFSQKVLLLAPWLQGIEVDARRRVAARFTQREFNDGEVILTDGAPGDTLYVVLKGCVRISAQGRVRASLLPGSFFGEMSWLYPAPCTATATAVDGPCGGRCTCACLPHAECGEALPESVRAAIAIECDMRRRLSAFKADSTNGFELGALDRLRVLGEGGFSKVRLCTSPSHEGAFALKMLHKGKIEQLKQVKHINDERDIVACLDHPFIIKMHATFQDARYLYILLEAAMGGELYSVLERQGTVHPVAAKFYSGCLVSVFEHLHQRRIVYRDLKPENVLIDAQGYPKLIDFGFGKVLQQRTRSTCGTPDYFAPEILQGRGYLWSVDWWCLGVLIYEMLYGGTPFEADSAMEMFRLILTEAAEMDESTGNGFPISDECRDVVGALLRKDPKERLVSYRSPDGEGVRKAAWFQAIDFAQLLKKEIPAPWTPSLSSPTDTSHFDEYDDDDLEPEPEDEPSPGVVWDF